ncbi:MAG TPA: hypothetical protein QGG35_04250 [Candidatus Marinimicrobia bacterium]|jgi:hypothetical protein|nr:hypothetical protein [Candidatus Neomarinimicrobiota bacterium]MDP7121602.1 hypothetical protein [Candidatus Neomarinimicrobiota bacterium]MDP7483074.1 hypothetical protein [Candidatus Neomarinimicrobiota bacterium]MDP7527897.1 hypothetical protein [Candidatus Neomarinimicrobiota bacterium]HJL84594.1 hypothetical protein [Candidatus Neomarinimicrobiota bacterium]
MSYVLFRSLQILALLSVLSGLYIGVRDRNLILEVQALTGGAALFYVAYWANERWGKQ